MSKAKAPPPPPNVAPPDGRRTAVNVGTGLKVEPTQPMTVSSGRIVAAQKVVVNGTGGIGKSTLCSLIPGAVFIDADNGSKFLDVRRVDNIERFEDVLSAVRQLANDDDCKAIVVDSLTKVEELAIAYTLESVPHEKGHEVTSIESYGWGKGYVHVYETFLILLQALDAAAHNGKHVIGTCHDCTASRPNPAGEDWIEYVPRLQSPPSGKGSIRHRVKEWCDHLLLIAYDVMVGSDGKAKGSGSRTIYTSERPTHWAKSRTLDEDIVYARGSDELWRRLFEEAGK